jgi:hypothetical protein
LVVTPAGHLLASREGSLLELSASDGSERESVLFPDWFLAGILPSGDLLAQRGINDRPETSAYDPFVRTSRLAWATGQALWTRDLIPPAGRSYYVRATADPFGNVLLTGGDTTAATFFPPRRWLAGRLDGDSGTLQWLTALDWHGATEPANGDADAVAVDTVGNVALAGHVRFDESLDDFAVAKLSGNDGRVLWQWSADGGLNDYDWANSVAVDDAGDVVAAGWSSRQNTYRDFTVVKLLDESGTLVWRRDIDWSVQGPPDSPGRSGGVILDPAPGC